MASPKPKAMWLPLVADTLTIAAYIRADKHTV